MTEEKQAPVGLAEGEYDLSDENTKSTHRGSGDFDKTPKFDPCPDPKELAAYLATIQNPNKDQEKGQGFTRCIAIPSMKGWVMRVRHYIGSKYYRCLQYQGYCPMCESEKLDKKERIPSDAFINNVILFKTPIKFPTEMPESVEWSPAFAVIGGKKVEKIRTTIKLYGNNPAGIPLLTTLSNPAFRDFDLGLLPERLDFVKKVIKQMVDKTKIDGEDDAVFSWKPEVMKIIEEKGLPKAVLPVFLCKELNVKQAIDTFGLADQAEKLAKLSNVSKETHSTHSSSKAKPAQEPEETEEEIEDKTPDRQLDALLEDL